MRAAENLAEFQPIARKSIIVKSLFLLLLHFSTLLLLPAGFSAADRALKAGWWAMPRGLLLVSALLAALLLAVAWAGSDESHAQRELAEAPCSPLIRNPAAVRSAAEQARGLLKQWDSSVPIKDRLPVMILFSRGFTRTDSSRLEWLRCALLKLQKHLLSTTPADIYVWTLNTTTSTPIIPSWLTPSAFPRVNVITIPEESWRIPCGLYHDSKWVVRKHFDIDYYLMGRWRLAFSLDFAKEMGYEYHLQFDDDAMLNANIPYNMISKFREKNTDVGFFSDFIGEVPHVVQGLTDLTYFWLKVSRYTPEGPILKHLRPPALSSLTTDGWDRMYHPGYFLAFSLSFYFRDDVQDYLTTILRSGKDIEGRWQEQSVMNMMGLLFVPEARTWVMQEVGIGHDRHRRGNFENWCVKTGLITL